MNRNKRRSIKREVLKIKEYTDPVEEFFLKELFESPFTYQGLYNYYNTMWQYIAEWYNKNLAKNLTIDPYWFHNQYKPLEKPYSTDYES